MDLHVDFLQERSAQGPAHQVDDDERRADDPDECCAALRHGGERCILAVDGEAHREPGMPSRIVRQSDSAGCRELPGIAGAVERRQANGVSAEIEPEGGFVSSHRFDVLDDDVFRPVSGRIDREFGISAGVDARVGAHHLLESGLLRGGDAPSEVNHLDARVAAIQVEAVDIALEFGAADGILGDEQAPYAEQQVGVRANSRRDRALGVADVGFEGQPRLALQPARHEVRCHGRQGHADGEHRQRSRCVSIDDCQSVRHVCSRRDFPSVRLRMRYFDAASKASGAGLAASFSARCRRRSRLPSRKCPRARPGPG